MRTISTKKIYTYLDTYKLLRSPMGMANNKIRESMQLSFFGTGMLADS